MEEWGTKILQGNAGRHVSAFENKINGSDEERKTDVMIGGKLKLVKKYFREDYKDDQGNYFL